VLGGGLERLADSTWPITATHAATRNYWARVAMLKADAEVFLLISTEHLDVGLPLE
jgi:hypothetical protein